MEVYLSRAFGGFDGSATNSQHGETTDEDDWDLNSVVPPHFYGELAKTDLGCQVLEQSGHVTEFARFIRQHGLEADDADLILKLKSVLWAVVSYFTWFIDKRV
jgi:rapamycin-insensitive companion of mTOR